MKKALIVANSSGLITLFLKNDVELLKKKGYQIDCACNTNYPDSNTDEFFLKYHINVVHVDFPIRKLNLKMLKSSYDSFKQLIKNRRYEVIHCHSTIAAVLARQCAKKYRKKGLKVLYTSHGFPFYKGASGKKAFFYKCIEHYYSRYTDGIITICEEDYNSAKKMHCKKVYKINGMGVDLDRFQILNFDRESYRAKLGFKNTDKVILSVGELNTNKNHQVVIRAISMLKDSNIVYAICGREVTEIGKKRELKKLAEKSGVKLVFLGFRSDIPEICHSVEIGALPSYKEGLGLSGIEMLAAGIPVVASDRQGIRDYIKENVTGFLCNPESAQDFSTGIKKTFELSENILTKEVCISAAKKFSALNARNKMDHIYKAVLGDR